MLSSPDTKSLSDLKIGEKGILHLFDEKAHVNGSEVIHRLREMGFAEGLEVEFMHHSLFGKNPIAVRVEKMLVALRRAEAAVIKVKLL